MKPQRRASFSFALLLVLSAGLPRAGGRAQETAPPEIDAGRLRAHIGFLASDELAGRDSGEPGLEVAAEYIALRFKEFGLEPAGDNGGYFQYFSVPAGAAFGRVAGAVVRDAGGAERTWEPWVEVFPFGFAEENAPAVEAPLVFAGYGITTGAAEKAKGLVYDDYAGVDVKGKVAIVLRFVPRLGRPDDPFGGKQSPYAPFLSKLRNAQQHGARGVVFVTPPGAGGESSAAGGEDLRGLAQRAAPAHATLPALLAATAAVRDLFQGQGKDLEAIARKIDEALAPASFELEGVRLRLETTRSYRLLRNVAGKLPGGGASKELSGETIVLGAHYDHIGRFGNQVSPKNLGQVHNGADDNASGVAGVLELARVLAARGHAPGRSIHFLCFSGEEVGLLGSRHWVTVPRRFVAREPARRWSREAHAASPAAGGGGEFKEEEASFAAGTLLQATGKSARPASPALLEGKSVLIEVEAVSSRERAWVREDALQQVSGPVPLHRVAAMVNLDMIGRAKENLQVTALGAGSSPAFSPLLEELAKGTGVAVKAGGSGMDAGGSDHWHFLRQGIPVIFFFTGMHAQYNTPDDDTATINFEGERRILELVRAVIQNLSSTPEAPPFNASALARIEQAHGKPRLGIEFNRDFPGPGVRVEETVGESPAARAGVRPGDIILALGKTEIRAPEDLMGALDDVPAGEEVPLRLRRGGEELKLAVVFPERQGRFQVSFGSVPDYAFAERGVRFEDIRAGSPAAKAGVKSGDILILWNGKEVENVEHWTGLLSSHKPGDVVPIRLKRGEASLDLEVKLEAR